MRLERVPISVGVGETIGRNRISAAMERIRTRLPQAEIELMWHHLPSFLPDCEMVNLTL